MWSPTTQAITPQAALAHKPGALEQAPRPPVIDPDEGVHAIDLVLAESPLKYCGHCLAHQSLAPLSPRQVERQLCPAVHRGPLVEPAGADDPIIGPESDTPLRQLTSGPTAHRPLDDCFGQRDRDNGIAGQFGNVGIPQVGVERIGVGYTERAQARSVESKRRRMSRRACVDHFDQSESRDSWKPFKTCAIGVAEMLAMISRDDV